MDRPGVPRPEGSRPLLMFCYWENAEGFRSALLNAGFRAQEIWDREAHGIGDLKGALAPRHEIIWLATKGRYTFPGARPTSVFRSMRLSGNALTHPNEKPVDLMVQLVEAVTVPGQKVLDPFLVSGTTGVACQGTGCSFIGVESDAGYFDAASRRIANAYSFHGLPVEGECCRVFMGDDVTATNTALVPFGGHSCNGGDTIERSRTR